MKLSTAISTPDAKFSAFALKGEFEDSFALAKRHGLDGVEIHARDATAVDAAHISGLMEEYGLDVVALGTGRAFGEDGLSFSSDEAVVRDAAVSRVRVHVELADKLGAKVIIGLILGNNPRTGEGLAVASEGMKRVADFAAGKGVGLLVETINKYETSFIITASDCLEFLDIVGAPNCEVLLDTFHMNIEESDMAAAIRNTGARIGHVHIADSNRRYPGAGHIDFAMVVSALRDAGYDGWLSAEMLPDPDPETSVAAMVLHIRNILNQSGC